MGERPGRLRRLFGMNVSNEPLQQEETEEYVEEITDRLTQQGYINSEEAGMIRRVVEFRDRTAAEIMVPRSEIFAISEAEGLAGVIDLIRDRGHSRIPFFKDDIDNIVGILYTKDLMKLWGKTDGDRAHLALLRPPTFIPEGKPVTELLSKFKADRMHIAIVIDEFGSTSGLVTLEDVIEEIFGDIQDEYDDEESLVTHMNDGAMLVDARLPIESMFDMLDLEDTTEDDREYDTVGGFMSHLIGRIPRRGEQVTWSDRVFVVDSANSRRVFKVRVLPKPGELTAREKVPSSSTDSAQE